MKKFILFAFLALLVIIVVVVVTFFVIESSNPLPLRESDEEIRENILELTPIGMDIENVLKVIESNKEWKILLDG